ncbi:D-hexose-6-phosphate mutarotase [bacterium]|nr:D-hexose-6-phosphate mutarotase [bacterium]
MITGKQLENGFEYIEVRNEKSCANIALQGAHVFHYAHKDQEPILWLSAESEFEFGKAIRGGVPICWPSFGMNNPNLPQHGFARTFMFELMDCTEIDENNSEVNLRLRESKESFAFWPYKFELEVKIRISDTLEISLTTTNKDNNSLTLTSALHSYFNISHIENIVIEGLENKPYLDALTGKTQLQNAAIRFNEEYDCAYQEVDGEIILRDKERNISIKNEGSSSVVVWNPWIDKCARMSGMNPEAYKEFVCIESANAFDDFKILKPNESHTLKATLS